MSKQSSRKVYCDRTDVDYTCGLGVVGNFSFDQGASYLWGSDKLPLAPPSGGTGFFVAGFINDTVCKATYKKLTKKHKLIYQSPVRVNTYSNNDFFFCIFDRV